jgi:hypothetical protein
MSPRIRLSTAALFAAACVGTSASANYIQLADAPTILAGADNSFLQGFAGVDEDAYVIVALGNDPAAIHKVADAGGSNTVSVQIDSATLSNLTGETGYSPAYFDRVGPTIASAEIRADELYSYGIATTNSGIVTGTNANLDAFIGNSGPTVSFGAADASTGTAYIYEGDTDSVIALNPNFTFSTEITDAELATLTGDDTISGLTAADGVLYFGNAGGSGGEGLYAWDTVTDLGTVLATSGQADTALSGSGGINPSNLGFFAGPDGNIYFFDTGYDAILSFDPDDTLNTLSVVLSQAELIAGPANSGSATGNNGPAVNVADLGWVDGELAFLVANSSTVTGQVAGLYAIPEPASLALMGLGGLAMLRRRSA